MRRSCVYSKVYPDTCLGRNFCGEENLEAPAFTGAGSEHGTGGKTKEPSALRRDAEVWDRDTGPELGDSRPCCADCNRRAHQAGITSAKIAACLAILDLEEELSVATEALEAAKAALALKQ